MKIDLRKSCVFILMLLNFYILNSAEGLKRQAHYYREPSLIDLATRALKLRDLPEVPRAENFLIGEAKAMMSSLYNYDLNAPPHITNGWEDFVEAEWPFMAMIYAGIAMTNLPLLVPSYHSKSVDQVKWILNALKKPSMSGFVKSHFGEPFPRRGLINKVSVFMHGHYLYLALQAKIKLGIDEFDHEIKMIYQSMLKNFSKEVLLPSYKTMYYITDNGSALAALSLYDKIFKVDSSMKVRKKAVEFLKDYCLDDKSNLVCTYIDYVKREKESGPRGTGVMYFAQFLPEIDSVFSSHQWNEAKRTLIKPLNQVIRKSSVIPGLGVNLLNNYLPSSLICMEHPNTLPWIERQWGDTDSGPVVLGVGTSACAFMIPAAIANGDKEMALSTLQLAQYMADYKWIGEKYVATNVFHEVGQAIIFYGKVLTLME